MERVLFKHLEYFAPTSTGSGGNGQQYFNRTRVVYHLANVFC